MEIPQTVLELKSQSTSKKKLVKSPLITMLLLSTKHQRTVNLQIQLSLWIMPYLKKPPPPTVQKVENAPLMEKGIMQFYDNSPIVLKDWYDPELWWNWCLCLCHVIECSVKIKKRIERLYLTVVWWRFNRIIFMTNK